MKSIAVIILSLLFVNLVFAQNKKEMEQKILQLEEKTKYLENEIVNIKTNVTNTTTTLSLVSKSNLELEKIVTEQSILIKKLVKQNDSLLIVLQIKKDTDIISTPKNEEDSIVYLIQSYSACKKWEDRTAYVLKPETVTQYMKEYYSDRYKPKVIKKDEISVQGAGFKTNEVFKVIADKNVFYCKKTSSGFRIDWMASTGFNTVSLKTFKANLSTQPTELRVKASIGSYYNYNYRDAKNSHWNVSIEDIDYNSIAGCYISKSSAEGKKLYEILKDGKSHALIIELKIDSSGDNSGNIAIITKLVKEGWSKE